MGLFDELLEDVGNVQGALIEQIGDQLLTDGQMWVDMHQHVVWYHATHQGNGGTLWVTLGHPQAPGALTIITGMHPINY